MGPGLPPQQEEQGTESEMMETGSDRSADGNCPEAVLSHWRSKDRESCVLISWKEEEIMNRHIQSCIPFAFHDWNVKTYLLFHAKNRYELFMFFRREGTKETGGGMALKSRSGAPPLTTLLGCWL